jgi:hypothetical protein
MSNTILIKRSSTPNAVPAASGLAQGELAINLVDGNLFYKNSSDQVTVIASNKFLTVSGNVEGGNIVTDGRVSAAGNVTGNYFIGNGSQLTGVAATTAASVDAGNLTGTTLSSNVTNSSLTSVGTLGSLSVTGTVTGGNIVTGGAVSATGNITGNYILGNGALLTGIDAASIQNGTSNVRVVSSGGNVAIGINGAANVAVFSTGGMSVTGNVDVTTGINASRLTSSSDLTLESTFGSVLVQPSFGAVVFEALGGGTVLNVKKGNSAGGNATVQVFGANGSVILNNGSNPSYGITLSGEDATISTTGPLKVGEFTGSESAGSVGQVLKSGGAGNAMSWGNVTGADITGQVANALVAGTVYTAAQPNITSVGTLTSVSVTGNVDAGNINGNGSGLSSITGANVTGQVANALVAGTVYTAAQPNITSVGTLTSVSVTGNVDSGNINATRGAFSTVAGTLETAAQPNITSVGTLSSLSVTGTVTGGNLATAGTVSAGGNITGNYIIGNGSQLTNVTATDVGTLATLSVTGNITSGNVSAVGNVTGANLVTTGTVFGNNALFTGNLTVDGNVKYINVENLSVQDPIIGLGRGPNNTPLTSNDGLDRGTEMWYYTDAEKAAFMGYHNLSGKLIAASNVSVSGDVVTVNQYGILVVGTLEGAAVSVTGTVTGGNLATGGTVSATGTITGGNVATGGTVSATGNITGGNVTTVGTVSAGTVTATTLSGNGSAISSITGANVTGQVGNALVAGTVYTAAQPNITSVGTLSSLSVTANITGGNITTAGKGNIATLEVTTLANIKATTAATNTTSGALVVAGGVGVGGNIYAGDIYSSGNLVLNVTSTVDGGTY